MKTLSEHAEDPDLILEGCGNGDNYYGVGQPYCSGAPEMPPGLKAKVDAVEVILRPLIPGFEQFCNFCTSARDGKRRVRYLCNYGHGRAGISFTGVDYQDVAVLEERIEEQHHGQPTDKS